MLNTLHWDMPRLWAELKTAIGKASEKTELAGCGVDTWGVDFALVGRNDTLLGNPVHYRDSRTDGILEKAFEMMPRERMYDITGLQFIPFNSVFQLLAMKLAKNVEQTLVQRVTEAVVEALGEVAPEKIKRKYTRRDMRAE
jgi:rhamnulokinase